MLEAIKKWFCGKEEEAICLRTSPMRWTVNPEDVLYYLIGETDNEVKIGTRDGIVHHRDGIIRIEVVKNGKKETFILTIEQLDAMGYIAPYKILS